MKLYKIFIPKKYNDNKPIPVEKTMKILNQIEEKFGGYSLDPFGKLPILGIWKDPEERKRYVDEIQTVELFTEDTLNIKKWFSSQKELWRQELEQKELFIMVQDAEIVT